MKKRFGIIALLLGLCSVLMCACMSKVSSPRAEYAEPENGRAVYEEYADIAYDREYGYGQETVAQSVVSSQPEKKIIKDANVDMKAADVKQAYADILAFAKQNGGYEFSQGTNTRGDYITLNATIKIPELNIRKSLVMYLFK